MSFPGGEAFPFPFQPTPNIARQRGPNGFTRIPVDLQEGCREHLDAMLYNSIAAYDAAVDPPAVPGNAEKASCPRNPAEQKAWAAVIVNAMKYMEDAQDNQKAKQDWYAKMEKDSDKIERAAWAVLKGMIKYFERPTDMGLNRFASYMTSRWEKVDSFVTLATNVCAALRHQKTLCKQLLMDNQLEKLIDNTIAAEKRVKNNRVVNQRKKEKDIIAGLGSLVKKSKKRWVIRKLQLSDLRNERLQLSRQSPMLCSLMLEKAWELDLTARGPSDDFSSI